MYVATLGNHAGDLLMMFQTNLGLYSNAVFFSSKLVAYKGPVALNHVLVRPGSCCTRLWVNANTTLLRSYIGYRQTHALRNSSRPRAQHRKLAQDHHCRARDSQADLWHRQERGISCTFIESAGGGPFHQLTFVPGQEERPRGRSHDTLDDLHPDQKGSARDRLQGYGACYGPCRSKVCLFPF